MSDALNITVVGDGLAGWMTANSLAGALGSAAGMIRVVPFPCADADGIDAVTPSVADLHPALEIDEGALLREDALGYSYGVAFDGWIREGAVFFQPFGTSGAPLQAVPFHQVLLALRQRGVPARLADFSMAALGAQAGRFTRPPADPRSVLSTAEYGLHLDLGALRDNMIESASARGVRQADGALQRVDMTADGNIESVLTTAGEHIGGDLYVDCTGGANRLIGELGPGQWLDWSAWLPCDRVAITYISADVAPLPYSQAVAHSGGWLRIMPLSQGGELRLAYSSGTMRDDEAAAVLARHSGQTVVPRASAHRPGRLERPWQGNCVVLGAGAAVVDPLMTTQLDVLRSSIDRLLRLLPATPDCTHVATEYNRRAGLELDNIRDFAVSPYKINGREEEPMWEACARMGIPDSLAYKLQTFAGRGLMSMYDEDRLDDIDWIGMLDAMGVAPRTHSQIVQGQETGDLQAHLERIRALMINELSRMPPYGDYLAQMKQQAASATRAGTKGSS